MEDKLEILADEIFSSLGPGYSERVYHNAFEVQLRLNNIMYETERKIEINFKNVNIGHIRADLIVDNEMVVELKVGTKVKDDHIEQCRRYMKLLNMPKGMIFCFPDNGSNIDIVEMNSQIKVTKPNLEYDTKLYEFLRKERFEIAKELNLPAYCIFYNSTLRDISIQKPTTIEDLMKINGIKEAKAEKYGERIVQIVKRYL
jgi:GxxExxY protein